MTGEAARFPSACVATPHYLATAAGLGVLGRGGNALDAAVAANLVLAVVAPYTCGFGGDCFALLWTEPAGLCAYNGSGRAPAAATPDAVRAAAGGPALPARGPLTVTVPGAVDAWFALLERFGTLGFADLARPALAYARDGFPLTARGAATIAAGRPPTPEWGEWDAVYGAASAGRRLCQPALAGTIDALAAGGRDAFYRGPVAAAVAGHVQSLGGLLGASDLAAHRGEWVAPLTAAYRGVDVVELPPNSQGAAALLALNLVAGAGAGGGASLPADPVEREHLLIEAVKIALAERDAHLTDPDHMRVPPDALARPAWADACRGGLGPTARNPAPSRAASPGTAYLCAVDAAGMCVSLIQSNYLGFGSGVTVPGWGINLQNRGAYFTLEPDHVNVVAPGKRTLHTLMPAMALRAGRPWLVFGAMGGDGQAQTHVQLLTRLVDIDGRDDPDLLQAIAAPRWLVDPADWSLAVEGGFPDGVVGGLERRGHRIRPVPRGHRAMGHVQAIAVTEPGLEAAADPRAEGLAAGF